MAGQSAPLWQWRRSIHPDAELEWRVRLIGIDSQSIAVIEQGNPPRLRLNVFSRVRGPVERLRAKYGGRVDALKSTDWHQNDAKAAPIRVNHDLLIVENARAKKIVLARQRGVKTLIVPAGMAFGSGSHATTGMILREMGRIKQWKGLSVLDLGCGSGILALAARQLGARCVIGVDNDPVAIRVARENEKRNFSLRQIMWRVGDLTRWPSREKFTVITANLYSELLCRYASRLWTATEPAGLVILSGILSRQEREVLAAWRRRCNATPVLRRRKGPWIMLVFRKKSVNRCN
jgi:ribosomal protein L11 methyltransferase